MSSDLYQSELLSVSAREKSPPDIYAYTFSDISELNSVCVLHCVHSEPIKDTAGTRFQGEMTPSITTFSLLLTLAEV